VVSAGARPSIHDAIEPLGGRRTRLRPVGPGDASALAAILADPTVARWWQTHDADAEAASMAADRDIALWLVEEGGSVVGLIQAHEETEPMYRHAGIDICLAEAGQSRGLGADAVRAVARWLIDVRGHHRLTIDPSLENERAIRTYASVGFRPVGTMRSYERWRDGTWHDGLLMDLLAGELVDDAPASLQ
jgi:aminoglycoside 6'-N-acetyltransferase